MTDLSSMRNRIEVTTRVSMNGGQDESSQVDADCDALDRIHLLAGTRLPVRVAGGFSSETEEAWYR